MAFLLQILSFALWLPFGFAARKTAPHPFFISVTEISQNAKEGSLEVSCKFFADDLEQTLETAYHAKLDISSPQSKAAFDKFIPDYIDRHLQLQADGKPLQFSYIGFEKEKESAYCYFEIPRLSTVKQLEAVNTLLHDFKNEQINIMHVTINGHRQSTKLDYPSSRASFRF